MLELFLEKGLKRSCADYYAGFHGTHIVLFKVTTMILYYLLAMTDESMTAKC